MDEVIDDRTATTTMPDIDVLRGELVGRDLPPGTFRVAAHQAWLHADALGSPALPDGLLHPMWIFNAALSGLGIDVEELFALGGISMDDGPMGGEMELHQHRALRVDEEVTVRGTITDLVRKQGSRGPFDLMTARLEVVDADDEVVGVVVNGYLLPRWG